ncbi:Calx-beta domain-containing protein [Gimesia aquarii]|uniref:Calx-beta domain protein n=1 Tax=Gimesia aquarii TaxID=2527964 RepID=A0A517X015_9PLAN|nr:Calx-beta domain-containing protein [Gimesia aquarii]QDU10851.1 Calx-beta domain protein [Gimesia aquarii]
MLLTNWLRSIASKCQSSRPRVIHNQRSRSTSRHQSVQSYRAHAIEPLEDRTLLTSLLSIDDVSVSEGDTGTTNVVLTVSRTGGTAGDLNSIASVEFTTADGTATTVDADYQSQGNILNFSADPSGTLQTQTITIQVNGDVVSEEDETFEVHLLNNSLGTTLDNSQATVTILNDDQSTLSINDITVNEADGTASVVVSLDNPIDAEVSFDFSIFDETANNNDDYLASSGSMSFAPGELSKTISVPIVDSNLVESTETFLVNLSNIQTTSTNLIVSDTLAKVRILDDDQASVSIDDISVNENDGTAMLTVSLNHPVDTAISVDFATAEQSALATNDYTTQTGTLIFNPGVQSQTIIVPLSDDNLVEGDETFLVNLTNLQNNDADVIMGDDQATVTILNDDQAQISISDITVDENAGTAILTVSLDHPVDTNVSVDFATSDNSAEDITDYLATSGTLTFTPGVQSIEIPVSIVDSELVELDESFLVNLTNIQASGRDVVFDNTQAEVTIQDDQQAHITIDDVTVSEDEISGMAILTVSLDRPVDTAISVEYTTNDLSALNTSDYTMISGTLNFSKGQLSATIMVPLIDDTDLVEGDETFAVDLMNLQDNGADVTIVKSQGIIVIEDNEEATISINDVTVNEGDGMATLAVSLDIPVETDVSFDFTTEDQTAVNPNDYSFLTDTLTFSTGQELLEIDIPITNDDLVEDAETLLVNLTTILANGANITFADPQGEITIQDDDQSNFSIDDVSVNEDLGTATITVSLNKLVDRIVSIDYSTTADSAIDPSDYASTSGTLTFAAEEASKTIDIPIMVDDLVENDESFFVNLTNLQANGADVVISDSQGIVTILNDDQASLSINDISIDEDMGTATLTVSLDKEISAAISVDYSTADLTALNGFDYSMVSGTLTFTPGTPDSQAQSITIPIINDVDIVEGDESFTVNLTNLQANGLDVIIGINQGTVTILDDEEATFSINDRIVNEDDGTVTFTVLLDKEVATNVSVDYATNDLVETIPPDLLTAYSSSDYVSTSGTLNFAPNQRTNTIIVPLIDDTDLVEYPEFFSVILSNIQANGANITFADDTGRARIWDNDQASFSIDDVSVDEAAGVATLTISLDKRVVNVISIGYVTADQSAEASHDYESLSRLLTFDPEEQSKTFTIPLTDDNLVENDETFLVNLRNLSANLLDIIIGDDQAIVTIEDNDQANLSIDDLSVDEDNGTATLTVSLDQPVDTTVTVDFSTSDLSAIASTDYTTHIGTLTFDPEVQEQTIVVPLIDNDLVEGDRTFQVNLSNLQTNGFDAFMGNPQATVTILDDDQATFSINDISINEDGVTALIDVSLDKPVETTVTVEYATADQTAFDTSDYASNTGTLTFLPGEQSQQIIVSIIDNMIVEGDETFLINLFNIQSNGTNVIFADDQAEVTILDNEQASFSIDNMSVDEDVGTATLTVSLNLEVDTDISVDFTTFSLTAVSPNDFTTQTGTLDFASGDLMKTIIIDITDDNLVEDDESLLVSLSNIQNAVNVNFSDSQGTILIRDNDQASVSIQDTIVNEDAGTVSVTVSLDNPVDTMVSVDYFTTPGSALDPDDYTSQTGTLTFNPEVLSQTIIIPLNNDLDIVEADETFLVNLLNLQPNGAAVTIGDDQATITIVDDETATISIDDMTVDENVAGGTVTLTVSLDQPVATTVTVDFTTADGSAESTTDYVAQNDTLTFAPGAQELTITLDITDDLDIVEGIESFFVDLANIQANGANITFADDQGEVTILDDETATISIDDMTVDENVAGGTVTLTVSLDQPVATTVTVDFTTADGSAESTTDYVAQNDTLTFAPGAQELTITLDITDDLDIVEGIESFFVDLANIQANGANITFADDQGEVTILDDETATISIDDMTVDEDVASGTVTLTVTLDQPVATTVTVDFATADQLAIDPDDYTTQSNTLTFNPGEQSHSIIVDIIDDLDIVEGIETFLVNLTNIQANGANITFADDQAEVTILDDETATIAIDDVTVNETDGTATLTVSLDQPVATTVTVDFATADQLALDPDDYTAQTGTLTFNPGEQSLTIIVDIIDDIDIVEGVETFLVNLTNIQANGANITFVDDQGEVTILDDEATTISIDDVTVNENDGTANLTVSLDQPVQTTVTVDFDTADQLALDPDDYIAQTGTLTFNPGVQSQTIVVDIIDNNIVEGIETFLVNLTNIQTSGANITFADDQGEVTILDDEQATIAIDDVTVNEFDGTATLTVTLDQPVATTVTVDFATADQLAVDPDDYTAQSGTLTFNPGEQSQEIVIDIIDTALVEFTETFLVDLTNIQANGANIIFADDQGEVAILDDDQSNLTINDISIDEMDGTAVLTVSLDNPVNTTINIDFITEDQSALNSIDYLFQSDSLTFNPGEQSKTITITILDNAAVEFDETFFVTLSNLQTSSSDVILADDQAEVTIVDDDQSTFSITDITVNEDAGTATVLVSLDQPVDTTVTVDFATVDNSATNPTDYLHHTGTLIFTLGEQPQTITVPIIDTDAVELEESFQINLSNIQANGLAVTFADDQSEVTIIDDDQTTMSINDVFVNEETGTVDLIVSLDQPVEAIITVDFDTVDLTATGTEDYIAQSDTLTFTPGEQSKTITIPIVNTDLVELSEVFFVNLSNLQTNGTDVTLIDDQAEVTIFDDDQSRLSIDDISVDEDAGFATLTVSLDSPVDTTVSVDFATTDQTAIDLEDYVAMSGTISFSPGEQSKTIMISIIDSFLFETDESFLVNLTNLQTNGRNVSFADNQAEVTIVDNIIASANIDLRVVDSPTNTQANGEVNLLPDNQDSITEWSSYWVEIWINASSPTNQGIFSVGLDLYYLTEFTSATDIEFGAGFSQNQAGTINDALGTVEGLFAETNASDLGIAGHLLFARIKFEPLAGDQVELDLPGRSIGPYDLGFNINSQQVHLDGNIPVTTNLVDFDGANIWANPFDLDDDDAINFKDLMLFASVYQTIPSESASDLSWFADYNQNNSVDFKDLSLFASNYNKSKLGQTAIAYPQNFPEAWNNPLIADTSQAEPQTSPVPLSQSAANSVLDGVVEYVSPQLTPSQNETLENINIEIVDLTGNTLGRAVTGTIYIDVNAAGYGWFIDDTPGDHGEFDQSSQLSLIALPDSDAAGRVDLWSVILHELGHLLGYDHESEGVMQETLAPGIRNLPSWELHIDLDEHSTPEEADSFFLTIQNETELVPF